MTPQTFQRVSVKGRLDCASLPTLLFGTNMVGTPDVSGLTKIIG